MTVFKRLSLTAYRRSVQFVSLLLLHSSWGPEVKWLCNPVLSCHSCVLSWFACPVGVFVHYSAYHTFPWLAGGTVLLLGVLVGRLLCGWNCPFGFLQDLLHKIPSPKFALPNWTGYGRYLVLLVMVFCAPFFLGEETLWSFCRYCPASALQVTVPNLVQNGVGEVSGMLLAKLAVLVIALVAAVVSSRAFCKVLCPIGAILSPLNLITFWKVKVPTQNCAGCGKCDTVCPQNGAPAERIAKGIAPNRSLECVVCHECQTTCPAPGVKVEKGKQ